METAVLQSIEPDPRSPRAISSELRARIAAGATLRPAGEAAADPEALLRAPYGVRARLELFGAEIYLSSYRFDDHLNFFVAFVGLRGARGRAAKAFYPRIFYKDSSLIWRVATHFVREGNEDWIGKGDVRWVPIDGEEYLCSAEETANLPYEMQNALDQISRTGPKAKRDDDAVPLVLRRGRGNRIRPFADFAGPRARAAEKFAIHGHRPIGRFKRKNDPTSLVFARGFEPDFDGGPIDVVRSRSRLYGGDVAKHRFLSNNGQVQFQFIAAHTYAWMNPPQALTTELSTFGVRTLDANLPEEAFVPGIEYHYLDTTEDPPQLHTQIPQGFAGPNIELDPLRADASGWTHLLPAVAEFRRRFG